MSEKITMSELSGLFGDSMPIEAVTILQKDVTIDEARAALNELADSLRTPAPAGRQPVAWETLTAVIRPLIEPVCGDSSRKAKEIADALLAGPLRSAATSAEPATKAFCRHCHDEVSTVPCCEACGGEIEPHLIAPTTSPEPDAVRETYVSLKVALRDLVSLVSTDSRYDDSESLRTARNMLFDLNKTDLVLASLSRPAHGLDTCDTERLIDRIKAGEPIPEEECETIYAALRSVARKDGQGGGPRS